MKKLFLIVLIGMMMPLVSYTQELKEKNVPLEVRSAMKQKFPDAYVYEWEWIKKEKLYEAEFMHKGYKHEAFFSQDGKWTRTEKEIAMKDLPPAVVEAFSKTEYALWRLDDVKEIITSKNQVIYNIEVEQGRREVELYFTKDGQLLDSFVFLIPNTNYLNYVHLSFCITTNLFG